MDAWVNVTVVPGGAPLAWALAFALVAEIPSVALCAWAALAGVGRLRMLRPTAGSVGGSPHSGTGASTTAARPHPCDPGTTRTEEHR
jgi:hypothetical protein